VSFCSQHTQVPKFDSTIHLSLSSITERRQLADSLLSGEPIRQSWPRQRRLALRTTHSNLAIAASLLDDPRTRQVWCSVDELPELERTLARPRRGRRVPRSGHCKHLVTMSRFPSSSRQSGRSEIDSAHMLRTRRYDSRSPRAPHVDARPVRSANSTPSRVPAVWTAVWPGERHSPKCLPATRFAITSKRTGLSLPWASGHGRRLAWGSPVGRGATALQSTVAAPASSGQTGSGARRSQPLLSAASASPRHGGSASTTQREFRASSTPAATPASTPVAAPPRERQPRALATGTKARSMLCSFAFVIGFGSSRWASLASCSSAIRADRRRLVPS